MQKMKCEYCETTEDVVWNDDGEQICTDCLFEFECERQMRQEENRQYNDHIEQEAYEENL